VGKLEFEGREVLLICRRIGLPLNVRKKASLQEMLNIDMVRQDGYTSMLVEFELVERKDQHILSRVFQKGSLNLHVGKEEDPKGRIGILEKNIQATLGQFKLMEIIHTEIDKERSEESRRDYNAIRDAAINIKAKVE
jgi:hypothetical protein